MIATDDLLTRAKNDIYLRLLGDELLGDVPVLIDDEHDMEAREVVTRGPGNYRNGRTGACIVVAALGSPSLSTGETPMPIMDIAVDIECLEDVLVNAGASGTGVDAGEMVARVVQSLHGCHFDDRFSGLRLDERGGIAELWTERAGLRGYRARFVATGGAFRTLPTCALVLASVDDGAMTLTCATDGATIRYTTDGSYPGAANPSALVYEEPIPVSPGDVIRAGAEKTGCNASKIVLLHAVEDV